MIMAYRTKTAAAKQKPDGKGYKKNHKIRRHLPGTPAPALTAVLGNFDFFVGAPVTTGAKT